jgi:3-hydroxyacyl-[acyl-carrier-protein] dehydratase
MRWFWIDRFLEFEAGRRAVAVKCVSLGEGYIDEYFSGYPVMTPSLVFEGFAQMGGLLISQQTDFHANVVLAKVARSRIHRYARPGDQLRYEVRIESLQEDGGLITAHSHLNGGLQAEAELTFAQVSRSVVDRDFFEPSEFLRMLRIFRLFDVGVDSQGQPLKIPEHLLAAERRTLSGSIPE